MDSADYVKHFLLNCGDDDLMDLIYPQLLDGIQRVEKIISHRLLGQKRMKRRDRMSTCRGLSCHRKKRDALGAKTDVAMMVDNMI